MKINDNFLKLEASYLFSTVAKKQREYQAAHPDKDVIRLSIGDVTKPLAPAVIDAMHKAVDEMANEATFRGYPPEYGYDFILNAIQKNDYTDRGIDIATDEIFLSDGAKSDCGNIGDIFSVDNKVAICDPVYPVYIDTNVMSGRSGNKGENGRFTVFFFSAFSVVVTAPYLFFNYYHMSWYQFFCLIMVGVCAAGGQFGITAAYTFAPSREISVYDYSNIIFTAIEGYLFLGQGFPDTLSLIGYAIICAMAIWMFIYNNRSAKAKGQS